MAGCQIWCTKQHKQHTCLTQILTAGTAPNVISQNDTLAPLLPITLLTAPPLYGIIHNLCNTKAWDCGDKFRVINAAKIFQSYHRITSLKEI